MAYDRSIRDQLADIDKAVAVLQERTDKHIEVTERAMAQIQKDIGGLKVKVYGISTAIAITISSIGILIKFLA